MLAEADSVRKLMALCPDASVNVVVILETLPIHQNDAIRGGSGVTGVNPEPHEKPGPHGKLLSGKRNI